MPQTFRRNHTRSRACILALFFAPAVALILALVTPGMAQTGATGGLDIQQLGQQLQGLQSGRNAPVTQVQGQQPDLTVQTFTPSPRVPPLPPSRLEQIMSARAGVRLEQFGYDQLGSGRSVAIAQTGAVQDDYVLGPGDQIIVSLRGQENSDFRAAVDRNGQVLLPRLKPISATGRSFGSFREDVEAAVHRAYVATDATVSIATVRQISVMVSGEVNNPGSRALSGLASVVDALLLAGGVRKTGSLRHIRIQRAGHEYNVDLYSVLTSRGGSAQLHLTDGDRILVPPLGRTVAVAGLVRQAGIYELAAGETAMSVRTLLAFAGGQEVRGRYRLSVLRVLENGQTAMEPLTGETGSVRDSEVLFVQMAADQVTGQATLAGGTGLAGQYPVQAATTLSSMLRAPGALGNTPYTLFGIIVRRDPATYLRVPVAFSPVAVLTGKEDQRLQSDDVVRVLSVNEAHLLSFVVRAYLGKLASDQAILRNPLDADASAAAAAANPNAPPVLGGDISKFQAIDPNNPARLASQALQVNENQFGMDDVVTAPADVQRADITALLDVAAPGTYWGRQQSESFLNQINTATVNATNPNASTSIVTTAPQAGTQGVLGGTTDQQTATTTAGAVPTQPVPADNNVPPLPGTTSVLSRPAVPDLAPNFESQRIGTTGYASNREIRTFGELCQQLGVDPLVLVNFLIDHRARVDGAVAGPGAYFIGTNVTLNDLVMAAGGTVSWADQSGVEMMTTAVDAKDGRSITQRQTLPLRQGMLASYVVRPHDQFRFNRVYSDAGVGSVTVQGEVHFTGAYPITRGERLSDLLMRAGGLTQTAYPQGTVFLRKSAAAVERAGYQRAANEIQEQMLVGMTRVGNDKIAPETFTAMQDFINRLRTQKAMGRVSFIADPSVLAAYPERDPLLEAGDVVYIPQRPSTISVLGEVMQPGTYAYQGTATLKDYIRKAGGYAQYANEDLTFIVLPDGSARKLDRSWFTLSPESLPPGSSIVVPRDLTPIDTRQIILDVTGIMSSLAVSLASLAVISR